MSAEAFAIADTCFLIDWASWRQRDLLFKLFKTVFVPESVIKEISILKASASRIYR
jgi:predicted nucleic acid-binding protein